VPIKLVPAAIAIAFGFMVKFLLPAPAGITPEAWTLFSVFLSTILGLVLQPLPVGAWAFLGLCVVVATKTLPFAKVGACVFANMYSEHARKHQQARDNKHSRGIWVGGWGVSLFQHKYGVHSVDMRGCTAYCKQDVKAEGKQRNGLAVEGLSRSGGVCIWT